MSTNVGTIATQGTQTVVNQQKTADVNVYAFILFLMCESLQNNQQTVLTDSKVLNSYANSQSILLQRSQAIDFVAISVNAKQATIAADQAINQKLTQEKSSIQGVLATLHQETLMANTGTNADVDNLNQTTSMTSSWIQLMGSIAQAFSQI